MSLLLLFPARPRPLPGPPGGGGGVWNTQNERRREVADPRRDDEDFMQLMTFIMPIILE